MRKYRSQRIQKTLMALSGAALASTMMFTSAQSISKKDNLVNEEYCKIVKSTQGMFNKESIEFYYSDENNFLDSIAKLRPIRFF